MTAPLERRLEAIVRDAPTLMQVLTTVRALDPPDWLLFSGAVYQTVLNHLTGRDPDHGVKDFDLGYYDAADTGYDAEDRVIRQVAAAFGPALRDRVEVRNQARVHLWFEPKFGEPYAPLTCTAEALSRFVSPTFAVGVRLEKNDRLTVAAPFGLEDLFALRLAPNPVRPNRNFAAVAARVAARWPEIVVVGAPITETQLRP